MVTTSFQNLFVMKKGSIFVEGYETEFLNPDYNTPVAPPMPPGPSEPGPGETEGPDGPIVMPAKAKKKTKAVKADE